MSSLGYFFQILAAIHGIVAIFFYCCALRLNSNSQRLFQIANKQRFFQFISVSVSLAILLYLILINDFSIEYVSKYSSIALPTLYKIAVLWSGDSGSLLILIYILIIFGILELFFAKHYCLNFATILNIVITIIITLSLILSIFFSNPFFLLDFAVLDGQGLEPILQNSYLFLHPLFTFASFAAVIIVFSYSLTTLIVKDYTSYWVTKSKLWTNISWSLLTLSLCTGAIWSYNELGWGGFWIWDPLETSTLILWLLLMAFFHSGLMFAKKGRMKLNTFILIFLAFEALLFSMFLSHSSVVKSLHSFYNANLGEIILLFMFCIAVIFIPLVYLARKKLVRKTFFNIRSRYTVFQIFNVIIYVMTFVFLVAIFFPQLSDIFIDRKFFITSIFYNNIILLFTAITFLLGTVSSIYPISKKEGKNLLKSLYVPFIFMLLLIGIIVYLTISKPLVALVATIIVIAIFSLVVEYIRFITVVGFKNLLYQGHLLGGMLAHLGLSVLCLGLLLASAYKKGEEVTLNLGESKDVLGFTLLATSVVAGYGENYYYNLLDIELTDGGSVNKIYPEMRVYQSTNKVLGELYTYNTFFNDFSVAFIGYNGKDVTIFIRVTPALTLVWVGLLILLFGTFVAMCSRQRS